MSDQIKTENQLNAFAEEIANEAIAECVPAGESAEDHREYIEDYIWQTVDGCQYVIYHYHAHSICQNCDVSNGEAFMEDIGQPENPTYDSLAVLLAFGEILYRARAKADELISEMEESSNA